MPTKISVAMSKEIDTPECESLVVTCSLEFDDDSSTLQKPETLQHAVQAAVVACHQAVQQEAVRRHRFLAPWYRWS